MASLSDINLDGYGGITTVIFHKTTCNHGNNLLDFAVGAPYDGPNERGAVYIYHGSKNGIREKYSQVIYAEDVSRLTGTDLSTFGFSVGGGLDMDGNDYPDMVVGAYLSNAAYFFRFVINTNSAYVFPLIGLYSRSRPVVFVESSVRFITPNKEIVLENKNCTHNNQRVPCTTIDFCVRYTGTGVPQSINLNLQFILDSKKSKEKRMFFLRHKGTSLNESWPLHKGRPEVCRTKEVYIMVIISKIPKPLRFSRNLLVLERNKGQTDASRSRSEILLRRERVLRIRTS